MLILICINRRLNKSQNILQKPYIIPTQVIHMPKKIFFSSLALAGLLTGACAPLDSDHSLEQRVAQQDMQLRQMQPQQADAWNQIQAMRQEINELKGQLNDLNNAGGARGLAEKVRQHDAALRQVDNNMDLNLDLGTPMNSVPPVPTTGFSQGIQVSGAPESSAYGAARTVTPAAPMTPTPESSSAVAPVVAVPMTGSQTSSYGISPDSPGADPQYQTVQAPSETTWGQADPKPELQVPQKDLSLALFDAGVNAYNSRNYTSAERSFNDFLKNYPNHSQSADAQYYLAECQFQSNNFPQAALAYDTVIKKYPKSSVAPGAYLKQAICFSKMDQKAAAIARMKEIINKFPNSPEAARAKSFLKSNK